MSTNAHLSRRTSWDCPPPCPAPTLQTVRNATALSPVLRDVDTEDRKYRNAARVARTVIDRTGRNAVVLIHDIGPTRSRPSPRSCVTPAARGYHVVTVSHLSTTL